MEINSLNVRLEVRQPSDKDAEYVYADVDWVARRRQDECLRKVGSLSLWWIDQEDGYEQQVTQDNCIIHATTSYPDDPLDHIGIFDERDEKWLSLFREDSPQFEELYHLLQRFATFIVTPDPSPDIIDLYTTKHNNADAVDDMLMLWAEGSD